MGVITLIDKIICEDSNLKKMNLPNLCSHGRSFLLLRDDLRVQAFEIF